MSQQRLLVTEEALEAFWEVVRKNYPQATSGDLTPNVQADLSRVVEIAVDEWIGMNVPIQRRWEVELHTTSFDGDFLVYLRTHRIEYEKGLLSGHGWDCKFYAEHRIDLINLIGDWWNTGDFATDVLQADAIKEIQPQGGCLMKVRFALPLLLLLSSAFAQTTITIGPGSCNTSPLGKYYCVGMAVTGIGTPGMTWASFWTDTSDGDFATGAFTIQDDFNNTVLLHGNNTSWGDYGSFTGTASPTAVQGTVTDPVSGSSGAVLLGMGTSKVCWRKNCRTVPACKGGTVVVE